MSESEIEAAAERYGRFQLYESSEAGDELRLRDTVMLATWACHRLAAERVEREERARPIDAEWFQEHGNDIGSLFVCRGDIEYELEWAAGTPGIGIDLTVYSGPRKCFCHSVHLPHVVTRGQLLDLLRVLKGGAE